LKHLTSKDVTAGLECALDIITRGLFYMLQELNTSNWNPLLAGKCSFTK